MMMAEKNNDYQIAKENYCQYTMNKADIHNQLEDTITKNNQNN